MFTADQLVAHAVGDYILQSDWMVKEKGNSSLACLIHVIFYTLPFLLLTQNPYSLLIIAGTHFVIDRWRLARFLVWVRNRPWPDSKSWSECTETGYPADVPKWKATWLYIIVDNILHILINGTALSYIG